MHEDQGKITFKEMLKLFSQNIYAKSISEKDQINVFRF